MTAPLNLDALQALCDAATADDWRFRPSDQGGGVLMRGDPNASRKERHPQEFLQVCPLEDAAFIAAARSAVPALIQEVRQLRVRVDELQNSPGEDFGLPPFPIGGD